MDGNQVDGQSEYAAWRKYIFSVQSTLVGISADQPDQVYGVIMDIGLTNADGTPMETRHAISITAFASGESSLKTSFGGGVIGLGDQKETIANLAKRIVYLAQGLQENTQTSSYMELPKSGDVSFFLLTTSGIKNYSCKIQEASGRENPFNPLFILFSLIKREADRVMDEFNQQKAQKS